MKQNTSPMDHAIALAEAAAAAGEVPVGAVIMRNGEVVAAERNRMRELGDPTAHAELMAIRAALAAIGAQRLADCDLYVTLEPCTMCAGAIAHAKIRRLYYAADDPKGGAVESGVRFFAQPTCHHAPEVISGLDERRAADMLKAFFAVRR